MKDFFSESDCDLFSHSIEDSSYKLKNLGISLEKANRLLREKGKVVTGIGASWSLDPHYNDTHTALLINIEPIEQDSERQVLADFVSQVDKDFGMSSAWQTLVDRAERLLKK